MQHYLKV